MTGRSDDAHAPVGRLEERFDSLARAAAGGVSRRQLAKLGGAAAASALLPTWARPAHAAARTTVRAARAAGHAQPAARPAKTPITGSCAPQSAGACQGYRGDWTPLCPNSVANGQQSEFNGCGPQGGLDLPILGKGDWIPDSPLDLADFFSACQGHDCCYGSCGKPKSVCDENFLNDMIAACNRAWPVNSLSKGIINGQYYALCLAVAHVYYHEVSATQTGQDAYNAGQKEVCNCCVDCQTYAQTLGALDASWWHWCPDPESSDGYSCMSVCGDMSNCGACGNACPEQQCDADGCQTGACQDGQCVYYPGNLDYCSACQGQEYCYSK